MPLAIIEVVHLGCKVRPTADTICDRHSLRNSDILPAERSLKAVAENQTADM